MEEVFGCRTPLSAKEQKETFGEFLTEALGENCDYDTVVTIHESLNEMVEEAKEEPEAPVLTKVQVKELLRQSGAKEEVLEHKALEVKTPDVIVKVDPEKLDLVQTKVIDGKSYLMIQIDDEIEVNGVIVKGPKEEE